MCYWGVLRVYWMLFWCADGLILVYLYASTGLHSICYLLLLLSTSCGMLMFCPLLLLYVILDDTGEAVGFIIEWFGALACTALLSCPYWVWSLICIQMHFCWVAAYVFCYSAKLLLFPLICCCCMLSLLLFPLFCFLLAPELTPGGFIWSWDLSWFVKAGLWSWKLCST